MANAAAIAVAFGSRSGEKRTKVASAAWKKPSPNCPTSLVLYRARNLRSRNSEREIGSASTRVTLPIQKILAFDGPSDEVFNCLTGLRIVVLHGR